MSLARRHHVRSRKTTHITIYRYISRDKKQKMISVGGSKVTLVMTRNYIIALKLSILLVISHGAVLPNLVTTLIRLPTNHPEAMSSEKKVWLGLVRLHHPHQHLPKDCFPTMGLSRGLHHRHLLPMGYHLLRFLLQKTLIIIISFYMIIVLQEYVC